ncbi:MAG TPA: NAD(P)H-dependent oxidoreductase, partial [Methanoregula sp.]|nr:NAD(P)H-dependent oxidoreductase [Methanoregula sp.]
MYRECDITLMDGETGVHRYSIAVIVGSLRKGSYNRMLAGGLVQLAPKEFSFTYLPIGDLPLYNQDDDDHQADVVMRMKNTIRSVSGLL